MEHPHSKTSNAVIMLLGIVTAWMVLYATGCSESISSEPRVDLPRHAGVSDFDNLGDREPTEKTFYTVADLLVSQGRDREAEFMLRRAIRKYPDFLPAYNALAELQMRQRRTKEAIQIIYAGLDLNPGDPVLLNNLGVCWIVRRDYDEALEAFTEAAGLVPENARYRGNMAVALGLLGRDEESLALMRQILPATEADHNLSTLQQARQNAGLSVLLPTETADL